MPTLAGYSLTIKLPLIEKNNYQIQQLIKRRCTISICQVSIIQLSFQSIDCHGTQKLKHVIYYSIKFRFDGQCAVSTIN